MTGSAESVPDDASYLIALGTLCPGIPKDELFFSLTRYWGLWSPEDGGT